LGTFVLVVGCRVPSGAIREPDYRPFATSDARPSPGNASRLHDLVAAELGIPSLAGVALPAGTRELRISTGHGMVYGYEYAVVRIVQDAAGSEGEVWRYRGRLDSSPAGRFIVRRVVLTPRPDWAQMVARLDALGADSLDVPRNGQAWMDVGELLLESRRGASYRSVAVNAPSYRRGEAARRAVVIATLIDSLDRASATKRVACFAYVATPLNLGPNIEPKRSSRSHLGFDVRRAHASSS
jgi:hypothetical protein